MWFIHKYKNKELKTPHLGHFVTVITINESKMLYQLYALRQHCEVSLLFVLLHILYDQ